MSTQIYYLCPSHFNRFYAGISQIEQRPHNQIQHHSLLSLNYYLCLAQSTMIASRYILTAILLASLLCHGICASESDFLLAAREMGFVETRNFLSSFGCTVAVITTLWNLIDPSNICSARPKHLLWALLFLKTYAKEATLCAIAKTNRTTFKTWAWLMLRHIAALRFHIVSQADWD